MSTSKPAVTHHDPDRGEPPLPREPRSGTPLAEMLRYAALVFLAVFGAALLGILSRPGGLLASFWPANALLMGIMARHPRHAGLTSWLAAVAAYLSADLLMGGTWLVALWMCAANLTGAVVGYLLLRRLGPADLALQRPLSVFYILLISVAAAFAAAAVGCWSEPVLFQGSVADGWVTWFTGEIAQNIAILPVVLTAPANLLARLRMRRRDNGPPLWYASLRRVTLLRLAPFLALLATLMLCLLIGGPGTPAFPIPALLWCALSYRLFSTALLTLLSNAWVIVAISRGSLNLPLPDDLPHTMMSLRLGLALLALGPITVASITAVRNELLAQLYRAATRDPLTHTLNRGAFMERAEHTLRALARQHKPVSVLMLDIDRFKQINDTYGHAAGDLVLAEFAKCVDGNLRDSDLLGRIGGEEFAAVLPDIGDEQTLLVAERIRHTFANRSIPLKPGHTLAATVSIGIARSPVAPSELAPLLANADRALYVAKDMGRNQVIRDHDGLSPA